MSVISIGVVHRPRCVTTSTMASSSSPRAAASAGTDSQRALRVALAPRRVADERLRGVRAALAGGEDERELGVGDVVLIRQAGEFAEQLGNLEAKAPGGSRAADPLPVDVVVVDRERRSPAARAAPPGTARCRARRPHPRSPLRGPIRGRSQRTSALPPRAWRREPLRREVSGRASRRARLRRARRGAGAPPVVRRTPPRMRRGPARRRPAAPRGPRRRGRRARGRAGGGSPAHRAVLPVPG